MLFFVHRAERAVVLFALSGAVACASSGSAVTPSPVKTPVRAEDMSAAEHRAEAQRQEDTARSYQGTADPAYPGEMSAPYADRVTGRQSFGVEASSGLRVTRARGHSKHAMQHRQAAKVLETFEEAECARSPDQERIICPILAQVSRVEDIRMGARLYLVEGSDTAQVVNHMRCHNAFGRAHGFEEMDGCPLYLKHLTIRQVSPGIVELVGTNASTAQQIQRRAREHVAPPEKAPLEEAR